MFDRQPPIDPTVMTVGIVAALACLTAVGLAVMVRRRGEAASVRPGSTVRVLLVGLAVASAVGVAVVGGVRSFEAVSDRFGSPLVPLTADGMIVACTALRIAALTRGWRIPGALATTYLFIGGTVWLNVAAAHDWSDAVAHALAPISYAILVEMLAHLLRLHLHLANPPRQRVAALAWATSPVVTTRVWLHLARTGTDDAVAARALVQQLIRLSSRLRMVCHGRRAWPFGQHRRTRAAALQVVRDGLLPVHQLAELLPSDGERLTPAVLLARIDKAALRRTACAPAAASEAGAPDAPQWSHRKHLRQKNREQEHRKQRQRVRRTHRTHQSRAVGRRGGIRLVSTAAAAGLRHVRRLARSMGGPMPSWSLSYTAPGARWPYGRSSGSWASAGPAPSA